MTQTNHKLSKVFRDVEMHRSVASIIIKHMINKTDVREIALAEVDFKSIETILDLGCGFGFFTEALAGKTGEQVSILGIDKFMEYKPLYLAACNRAGIAGKFVGDEISYIRTLESGSFDVILCSYALYFFPDYINEISRLLKDDGVFVTITHARPHMIEFTTFVKEVFDKHEIELNDDLPFDKLIEKFCDMNGKNLLSEFFGDIREIPYRNRMVFGEDDYPDFSTYLCFKRPFFMPPRCCNENEVCDILLDEVKEHFDKKGGMKISKNDMIFLCKK